MTASKKQEKKEEPAKPVRTDRPPRREYYIVKWSMIESDEPTNPRNDYGNIPELAESLRANGVQQPLACYKLRGDKYLVSHGHRRWRAGKYLWETYKQDIDMPVIPVQPKAGVNRRVENVLTAIVQNDGLPLNPIEQAYCIRILQEEGLTEAEIATKCGKTQAWVNKTKQLNDMPEKALILIRKKEISPATAIQLKVDRELDQFIEDFENGLYAPASVGYLQKQQLSVPFDATESAQSTIKLKFLENPANAVAEKMVISNDTVPDADPSSKSARITKKDIDKQQAIRKPVSSWQQFGKWLKKTEPNPKKAEKARALIFMLKLHNNEATEADFEEFFS
jgi:ParB/RepB/Spo0J family partition protein